MKQKQAKPINAYTAHILEKGESVKVGNREYRVLTVLNGRKQAARQFARVR